MDTELSDLSCGENMTEAEGGRKRSIPWASSVETLSSSTSFFACLTSFC